MQNETSAECPPMFWRRLLQKWQHEWDRYILSRHDFSEFFVQLFLISFSWVVVPSFLPSLICLSYTGEGVEWDLKQNQTKLPFVVQSLSSFPIPFSQREVLGPG